MLLTSQKKKMALTIGKSWTRTTAGAAAATCCTQELQGNSVFPPLLKFLAAQKQYPKLIFTQRLNQKMGNSRFTITVCPYTNSL